MAALNQQERSSQPHTHLWPEPAAPRLQSSAGPATGPAPRPSARAAAAPQAAAGRHRTLQAGGRSRAAWQRLKRCAPCRRQATGEVCERAAAAAGHAHLEGPAALVPAGSAAAPAPPCAPQGLLRRPGRPARLGPAAWRPWRPASLGGMSGQAGRPSCVCVNGAGACGRKASQVESQAFAKPGASTITLPLINIYILCDVDMRRRGQ